MKHPTKYKQMNNTSLLGEKARVGAILYKAKAPLQVTRNGALGTCSLSYDGTSNFKNTLQLNLTNKAAHA